MKILISATLIVLSSAVSLEHSPYGPPILRASSQEECNQIETVNHQYWYKFNPDACACFFTWTYGYHYCRYPTVFNPFHEPGNRYDLCIHSEEYDAIFDHDLGPDCKPLKNCDCLDDAGIALNDNGMISWVDDQCTEHEYPGNYGQGKCDSWD